MITPPVRGLALALVVPTLFSGCAEPTQSDSVSCTGKCDGFDKLKSIVRDARDLDLDDLVLMGAPLATSELNNLLSVSDYGQLKVRETEVFDEDDIDRLATGLAARFGESDLSTEVNALRRRHLQNSRDEAYGDSAFVLRGQLRPNWGLDTGGFGDVSSSVGFDVGADLEARVITAYDNTTDAILKGPLKAAKELRGFVLPRDIDDIRKMKPGDVIALHATGHLGVNLGASTPILIAEPGNVLQYHLILSAALRTRLGGELDIQLVRLDDDAVVVDVGIQKATVRSASLALEDRWGVQGLLELSFEIGGIELDLGKLVEKALKKQLNRKLDLISGRLEKSKTSLRMSVARLRFNLNEANPELLAPALAQTLRGDVRLAQALSNRGEPGIRAEFDMLRSGATAASYAGIDIFGLSLFAKSVASEGAVVVQTPAGAQTLLWDSLHKESGFFFSRHGHTRVALSGMVFDPRGQRAPRSDANLIVEMTESDKLMERDKLIDHLDGIIIATAGISALRKLEGPANDLQRFVGRTCDELSAFDSCYVDILDDPRVGELMTDALGSFGLEISRLSDDLRALLNSAAELRLIAQSVFEFQAAFTGPKTDIVVGYRLDTTGVDSLMIGNAGERFADAVLQHLQASEIRRLWTERHIEEERVELGDKFKKRLEDLAAIVDGHAIRYRTLGDIEQVNLENINGALGASALEIQVPIDRKNRPIYEDAAARSIVQAKADIVAAMFDELRDAAKHLGPHKEQVVGYGLLGMAPAENIELRLDVEMNIKDERPRYSAGGYPEDVDVFARGNLASPIDGGMFNVDSLINLD